MNMRPLYLSLRDERRMAAAARRQSSYSCRARRLLHQWMRRGWDYTIDRHQMTSIEFVRRIVYENDTWRQRGRDILRSYRNGHMNNWPEEARHLMAKSLATAKLDNIESGITSDKGHSLIRQLIRILLERESASMAAD